MSYLLLYDPLCIPDDDEGFRFIDPSEIIYVEGMDRYCNIYCRNKVQYKTVSIRLHEILDMLPKRFFYQVHKSYIVSRLHIKTMNKSKTRIYCLDNITVNIGEAYRPAFLRRFKL